MGAQNPTKEDTGGGQSDPLRSPTVEGAADHQAEAEETKGKGAAEHQAEAKKTKARHQAKAKGTKANHQGDGNGDPDGTLAGPNKNHKAKTGARKDADQARKETGTKRRAKDNNPNGECDKGHNKRNARTLGGPARSPTEEDSGGSSVPPTSPTDEGVAGRNSKVAEVEEEIRKLKDDRAGPSGASSDRRGDWGTWSRRRRWSGRGIGEHKRGWGPSTGTSSCQGTDRW